MKDGDFSMGVLFGVIFSVCVLGVVLLLTVGAHQDLCVALK